MNKSHNFHFYEQQFKELDECCSILGITHQDFVKTSLMDAMIENYSPPVVEKPRCDKMVQVWLKPAVSEYLIYLSDLTGKSTQELVRDIIGRKLLYFPKKKFHPETLTMNEVPS